VLRVVHHNLSFHSLHVCLLFKLAQGYAQIMWVSMGFSCVDMWYVCVHLGSTTQEDTMKLHHYIIDTISLLGIFAIALAMLAL
jgi:hypothetical protein